MSSAPVLAATVEFVAQGVERPLQGVTLGSGKLAGGVVEHPLDLSVWLLSIIYDDIDKHDSLERKEALFEIESPEVCELVEEALSRNKNISKTRSYWNDKYQTCFLVVDWE